MNENRNDAQVIWIDPDDAPELTDDFFKHAALYDGTKLIREASQPTIHNS